MIAWWKAMFASEYSCRCWAGRQGVKLVEHVAQRADVGVRRVQGGEPRRHAFERGPDLDHFDDLLLGLPDDEDAAPRDRA